MTDRIYTTASELASAKDEMIAIRRHLHAHPELSFEEAETARFVADKLRAWGYDVTPHVGGHGVVACLSHGQGSRSIAIRADMDALPITEETGVAYQSEAPGRMHACGHDGHMAILLGAARHLAATRRFDGKVTLIFQPAEEPGSKSGAQAMISDGLFERFPFDVIFGLHNTPGIDEDTIQYRHGPMMASSDIVLITIKGRSGHGAKPHLAVDPIVAASTFVLALQTIVSRNVDPFQAAVVTVGTFNAGEAPNIISESASLSLTVRCFDDKVRILLEQRIRELATTIAKAHEAEAFIDFRRGYPSVVNATMATDFARTIAEELVGIEHVSECALSSASEDFAYFLEHKPGSFLRLGNGVNSAPVHNARYDFSDESLVNGAALWARLVERYLNE